MTNNNNNNWSADIETILENIRVNCLILSKYHKKKYLKAQASLKYYRIPTIVISSISGVIGVGLQPYIEQNIISMTCCAMSLIVSIIGAIEMYLQIQKRMESDLILTKELYIVAVDIQKTLSLTPEHRNGDGVQYLENKFSDYIKMVESASVIEKTIVDKLAVIDVKDMGFKSPFTSPFQSAFPSPAHSRGGSDVDIQFSNV